MLFSRSQVGVGGCISTEMKMMMIRMLFSLNLMPQQEWELKHFAIAFVPEESILHVGGV